MVRAAVYETNVVGDDSSEQNKPSPAQKDTSNGNRIGGVNEVEVITEAFRLSSDIVPVDLKDAKIHTNVAPDPPSGKSISLFVQRDCSDCHWPLIEPSPPQLISSNIRAADPLNADVGSGPSEKKSKLAKLTLESKSDTRADNNDVRPDETKVELKERSRAPKKKAVNKKKPLKVQVCSVRIFLEDHISLWYFFPQGRWCC